MPDRDTPEYRSSFKGNSPPLFYPTLVQPFEDQDYACEILEIPIKEFLTSFRPHKIQKNRNAFSQQDKATINSARVNKYSKKGEAYILTLLSSVFAPPVANQDNELLQGNHRYAALTRMSEKGLLSSDFMDKKIRVVRFVQKLPTRVESTFIIVANRTATVGYKNQIYKGDYPISNNDRTIGDILIRKSGQRDWMKTSEGLTLALNLTYLLDDPTLFNAILNRQPLDLEPHEVYEVPGRATINDTCYEKIPRVNFDNLAFKENLAELLAPGVQLYVESCTKYPGLYSKTNHLRWVLLSMSLSGKISGGPGSSKREANYHNISNNIEIYRIPIQAAIKSFPHSPKTKALIAQGYLLT